MSVAPIPVCLTCLSTTRNLYPIEDGNFFASLTLLKLSDSSKCRLCWECYAVVKRARRFRDKALKAHAILTGQCIPAKLPLSSLCYKELKDYIYIQHYPPIMTCEAYVAGSPGIYTIIEHGYCKNQTSTEGEGVKTCPSIVLDEKSGTNQTSEQESVPSQESQPQAVLAYSSPQNILHEELILKEEVIENDPEEIIESDPYEMGQSEAQESDEPVGLDIVKTENYNSSDDEFLDQKRKENTAYIIINYVKENETEKNATPLNTPAESTVQYFPMVSLPIQYEPLPSPSNDIETPSNVDNIGESTTEIPNTPKVVETALNVETIGKCTIRTLTEKEMIEVRREKLGQTKKRKRYFCDKCVMFFRVKSFYESHMQGHKESAGEFKCNICETRFESKAILMTHISILYRIITCNTCSEEFTTYHAFNRHYEQHQDTEMTCCNCGEKFPNKSLWRRHVQKHKPYVECTVCKRKVRKDLLSTHTKSHLPQPLLECDECGKKFLGQYKLAGHIRVRHTELEEGEAYCAECDKQFKSKSQYKMHLRTSEKHVTEKRMQCKICLRKFTCLLYLRRHMARSHSDNDCNHCSQKFPSDYALRRHVMLVHEKRRQPKNKICDYCGRGFAVMSTLRQHIYAHMNIRPYKCKYCGIRFNYDSVRYTHIKLKHKKKK